MSVAVVERDRRGWVVVIEYPSVHGGIGRVRRRFDTRAAAEAFGRDEQEPRWPRFPVMPLVELAGSVTELARRAGVPRSSVQVAMRNGVRPWRADAWAGACGAHPSEVWGDAWWDAAGGVEANSRELAGLAGGVR